MDLRVLLKVEVFGEDSLSKEEYARYNKLLDKEINENIYDKNPIDGLILKF
jgi:hypothetical protein